MFYAEVASKMAGLVWQRDNPKRKGGCFAYARVPPSPFRFSLCTLFPDSPSPLWLPTVPLDYFFFLSLFIAAVMVFGLLFVSAGIGSMELSEAANSGVCVNYWERLENCLRRELAPALPAEGNASGGSPQLAPALPAIPQLLNPRSSLLTTRRAASFPGAALLFYRFTKYSSYHTRKV